MQMKSIAFAAGLLCAAGAVSAQTLTVNAAGASATRATITNAVIESVCGATGITLYQNGTNVTRITCPSTAVAGFTALDFSYDNTTGSFLGVGPVSGNGQLTARVNIGAGTTCGTATTTTIAGKSVSLRTGCGNEAGGVRPSIGNADVEPTLFTGVLQPAGVNPYVPSGISQVTGQFGIIFGINVSLPLYRALQADQGLVQDDTEANAPSLSTAQVASIATNIGGPLNTDWTPLFRNAAPAAATQPVRFVRRVAGSGSHATFSAVNLNINCAPADRTTPPAAALESTPTYTVLEYGATGVQIQAVDSVAPFPTVTAANASANAVALNGTAKPANYYAMGYASLENAPAASGNGSGWRFVKLDGQYPSKANAQGGRYNWMAEQVLTLRTGATAAEESFFTRLAQVTGSPSVIANFSLPTRNGVVALPFVADAGDPNYLAQRTRYRTFGNSCVRPTAVE